MPPKGTKRATAKAPAHKRAPAARTPGRSSSFTRTSTGLRITTVQKVLIAVAVLAGFGAIAAGFASLPASQRSSAFYRTSQYKTLQTQPIKPEMKKRLAPGMVIKANNSTTVYYYAADKQRYVIPSVIVYKSWFDQSKKITTISATQLESIPLGGQVRLRPGSYLVKSKVSPKIYTISKGGELHLIPTEATAIKMYGAKWPLKTVDLPDYQFAAYHFGTAIEKNAAVIYYSPANMFKEVKTIDQDLGLVK